MILLNGESLSKSFGTKELFHDLSLSVFEGNRIGLIGPNGSGKSTLLKILLGTEKADTGRIALRRGLTIGYLPQACEFEDKSLLDVLGGNTVLAKTWLSKLGFTDFGFNANCLSGGWKKRLRLAQEMLKSPDLLLLDEPTNHLDLEGILWLEGFLKKDAPTYLVVSHDRYFLQHVTNRIIEIDRSYPNGLFSIEGSYENFLSLKEDFLQGQLQHERSLASKARREEEWLRSNAKARTTKSTARIDEAHELLDTLSHVQSRNQQKKAEIAFVSSERETRKLLTAKNISAEIDGKILFKNLDFTLSPGTRVGLMGPNGSGKTTLLRILAEEISSTQGTIKRADNLKVVYFDQHRDKLPGHLTLKEALSPSGDFVTFHGKPIHINGWCKKFLFSPDLLPLTLNTLSGGERARISIAHLMLKPADILLLDEPTNDLDIPTLETLEASLINFPGAVVLITHDRCMIDRICNTFITLGEKPNKTSLKKESKTPIIKPKSTKKIEEDILKLENEVKILTSQLESTQDPNTLNELCTAIGLAETKIEHLYILWEQSC